MSDPVTPTAQSPATPSGARSNGYMASTVKHGLIYFLGNALARLAGFIMLPVYTRVLTTGDYGVLEILSVSADVLSMIAGLGIRQAMLRLYYQHDSDEERHVVVSTAALLVVAIFGCLTVGGLALARPISEAMLGPDQPLIYVQLAVVSFVVGALGDIPGVHLQASQRSSTLVTSNLVRLLGMLALNILFIVVIRTGVKGIFLSNIIASCIVGGFLAWRMFREIGMRFDRETARALIKFGTPLVASNLGSFVLHFSDRYFLRFFHALNVVGVYALSYKFAMLIAMFVAGPFSSIWTAKALEIHRREAEGAPPILRSILKSFSLTVVTVALGTALYSRVVIDLLLGPEFRAADEAIPLLSVGMVFFCFRNVSQTGAMIAKRPGLIAKATTSAAVVALLLNLLLIPRWGGMGAAAATAGAFGVEFMLMRALSERAYAIGLTLADELRPLGIACLVAFLAEWVVPSSAGPTVAIALRSCCFGLYLVAIASTGDLTPEARGLIRRSVRDPRAIMAALRGA